MMEPDAVRIGQIYVDARPPRREWRVEKLHDGTIMLVRVDKPSVSRFVDATALCDTDRYVRKN
jgi:hypothetical protein